jgi:hypothetical protein
MTRRDFFVTQNNLTKPDTRLQTYRANIGGPIVRDKAHSFYNLERVMVNRANSISIPSHPELNASPVTKDRVWNTLMRLDHQLSRNNTWTVRWLRESSPQLNQIVPYPPPFAGAHAAHVVGERLARGVRRRPDGGRHANTVLSNTRLNTVRFNFTREDVAFANPGFNGNGQDQAALDPQLVFLTFVDQQSNVAQARVNDAYQIDDTMSWFIAGHWRRARPEVRRAVRVRRRALDAQDNLNGTFFFRSDAPFNAANPATYPERLQVRVPGAELLPESALRLGRSRRTNGGSPPAPPSAWAPLRHRGAAVRRA